MISSLTTIISNFMFGLIMFGIFGYIYISSTRKLSRNNLVYKYKYKHNDQGKTRHSIPDTNNTDRGVTKATDVPSLVSIDNDVSDSPTGDIFYINDHGRLLLQKNTIESFITLLNHDVSPFNKEKCSVFPNSCQYRTMGMASDISLVKVDYELYSSYQNKDRIDLKSINDKCLQEQLSSQNNRCSYIQFGHLSISEQLKTVNNIIDEIYELTDVDFELFSTGNGQFTADWELTEDGRLLSPSLPDKYEYIDVNVFHIVGIAYILGIKYRKEGKQKPSFTYIGDWSINGDKLRKYSESQNYKNGWDNYNHSYALKLDAIFSREDCEYAKNEFNEIHEEATYDGKPYDKNHLFNEIYIDYERYPMKRMGLINAWNDHFCSEDENSLNDFIDKYNWERKNANLRAKSGLKSHEEVREVA